jgi:hypothetical protein
MIIKCIVAVVNSNGEPDLFFVKVDATQSEIDEGEHYNAAEIYAKDQGHEPHLAYDENDRAGNAMLPLFVWETASIVGINGVEKIALAQIKA